MPSTKISLLIAVVILLGYSCKKTDLNSSQGLRLVKTVGTWADTIGYEFFKYDAEDKLAEIIDSSNNSRFIQTTFIYYDYQGRVSNWQNSGSKFTLVYDNAGSIVKQVDTFPVINGSLILNTHLYTYDEKNRMISDSIFNSLTNKPQQYILFTYDDNDNLIRYQEYEIYQAFSEAQLIADYQYTYNGDSNPYLDLGIIYYFITENPYLLSRHCVLTEEAGETIFFNYEYNNSLMKKITITTDPPSVPSTIEFYYE